MLPCRTLRLALAAGLLAAFACTTEIPELLLKGDTVEVRERPEGVPDASTQERPALLLLALDGVDRDLLYGMLRAGELPELARLLGGEVSAFPHAYFAERLLSTLPSSTMPGWVTALTGVGPAQHGVTGNEFFIREDLRFAAPIPTTFSDPAPLLACFTDGYANGLVRVPSVYERMRWLDPHVLVWVAMHHFHRGADRLLIPDAPVIADGFRAYLESALREVAGDETSKRTYQVLDEEAMEEVVEALEEEHPPPDVLTVYLSGIDLYAHVAAEGPDAARRTYLREALEPLFAKLHDALARRGALEDRFVVVVSDHGHTEVVRDAEHALATSLESDPPGVLAAAGFRVRPFQLEVEGDGADFQAVLAYQGAMAFVYLADRSTCPRPGDRCDWSRPPRFEEDVLAAAEAFHANDRTGELVPALRGVLHLVLARRPRPFAEVDEPFSVYTGSGRLTPVGDWLARHPEPRYVALAERLAELAAGPAGERAGDLLLVAHNGDREEPARRYYFSSLYRSWHGSPSRQDAALPLIVAHPRRPAEAIAAEVEAALGERPHQQRVTDLLLRLRYGADAAGAAGP